MKKSFPLFVLFIVLSAFALSGCSGSDGAAGATGATGATGADGAPGAAAVTTDAAALSAAAPQLATAAAAGFTGTATQLLTSTYSTAAALGYTGTATAWTALQASANQSVTVAASVSAETCAVCHKNAGTDHQALYNKYVDASPFTVTIDSVASVANADPTKFDTTITFTIKENGAPYVDVAGLPTLKQKTFYAVQYDSATRQFINSKSFAATTATPTATAGQYTVTATALAFAPETSNSEVYLYIAKDQLAVESVGRGHYALYDKMLNVGKTYGDAGTYVSAANVAACEKCHGAPYAKHGYRMAKVTGLADMAACKTCHYDTRNGGHAAWQLLVDDPAAYAAQDGVPTAAQNTLYAYKANVMNDTHMSHAMEFAYPQSMANCVMCHEGKLTTLTLTDANFTLTTCKSCHPMTGPAEGTDPKRAPALATAITHAIPADGICNTCHKAGGIAPAFSAIHTGYDKKIYAKDKKYSDIFKVTINSTTVSSNKLTIKFSATKTDPTGATTLAVTGITPTVAVGLYGYNTKDFIVDAHGSTVINGVSARNLEYVVGATHPRFTTVSAANGSWEVTADLSLWAAKIADGTVKRAAIVVMPALKDAAGDTVALDAPSSTFTFATGALAADVDDIVKVKTGCNNCHGALGITFHSGSRGGSMVACRICHTTRSGGSHLEMQSRSIDSYVHSIHAFQPFDPGDIDFTDPVEALHYEHHIESTYPNFTLTNCESCHNAGKYEAPDQAKSLGGTLSKADTVAGRNIGAVPSYVTGPGSRACGSCHRSAMINEDQAGELAAFNQHVKTFGYLAEVPTTTNTVFDDVITKIMQIFK
ncbi:MAG: multiheme c-type cytochrome [Syntrophales bacterium]